MSMSVVIVYGYGVDGLEKLDSQINEKKMMDFFKKHLPEEYQAMKEDVEEQNTEECIEWMDSFPDEKSEDKGIFAIVSTAMTRETGIRFEYHTGEDRDAILFAETFPWNYSEVEKELTQDSLSVLYKKYFGELGFDVEPDSVGVEYYG